MSEYLSSSKISTWDACKRKFYWTYEEGIEAKGDRTPQVMGRGWSHVLEHGADSLDAFYAPYVEAATTMKDVDDIAHQQAVIRVLHDAYRLKHPVMEQREVAFNIEEDGFSTHGYMDGILGNVIVEDKLLNGMFFGDAAVRALALDLQTTHYIWAAKRHMGIDVSHLEYRVTIKPGIRRRTTRDPETANQFIDRLRSDVAARPDHYFRHYHLFRSDEELDDHFLELQETANTIEYTRSNQWWKKSRGQCGQYGGCQFLPLCSSEEDAISLYQERTHR